MTGAEPTAGNVASLANFQAEQQLLGAILRDNALLHQTNTKLAADRFADPVHQAVYCAIQQACQAGRVATPTSLRTVFEQTNALDRAGGSAYLAQLAAQAPPIHAEHYIEAVHGAWLCRLLVNVVAHLRALADDVAQGAFGDAVSLFGEASPVEQADFLRVRLEGLVAMLERAQ